MQEIAVSVLGVGAMGRRHARALAAGQISGATLAAVCDPRAEALADFEVPGFRGAVELVASGLSQAVVIATPHPLHASLARLALERGLPVLVEKPAFVHTAEGERLLALHAALPAPPPCGVVLTLRADPRFALVRELVRGGALGKVHRFSWVLTDRFRPSGYYAESPWRGTWAGEGGGLLLNQCAHQLDQLGWWFGKPRRARAFCRFGRFHDIEVEDDVSAYLEFEGDVSGTFVASTGEAPGTQRLEIAGELAKLVFENDELTLFRSVPSAPVLRASPGKRASFVVEKQAFDPGRPEAGSVVLQNFVDAVRGKATLMAPLAEGLASVELANAMILSSVTESTVEFPLDSTHYESLLEKLTTHD